MPLTTYVAGDVLTAASLNNNFTFAAGAGGVVQVKSTTKTDTFSTSSVSFVDVTGVSQAITPTSASNKVLVFISGMSSCNGNFNYRLNLNRDSTAIAQSTGSGNGDQTMSPYIGADAVAGDAFSIVFLDNPATTSAITYKLQIAAIGATVFVGRFAVNDLNRSVTTITVMEVAP